jgi:hypothetical protein
MRNAQNRAGWSAGLWLAALALLLAGPTARAQQANYPLPKQPTGQVGNTYYYAVPLGFTWDNFAYVPNGGDWNVGDHGFDAGEAPGNPTYCGPKGDMCTGDAGGPKSTAFITINNDPTHGFSNIPILLGPSQDGFNNVFIANGQSVPVVPGRYTALYLANTQVNGPRTKMLTLNYADSSAVMSLKWADWCAPSQSPPDFFTWPVTHRLADGGGDGNSCTLITKYIPVDPNRVLTSISIGTDSPDNGGGIVLPGDTATGTNGRTLIGAVTLASTDPNLGGYGFVSGHIKNAGGTVQSTPAHAGTGGEGYDVFVLSPALGNYGAGANVDGSYTIGLPAGTYVLSAAVRDGSGASAGPQAAPVTVTVEPGKTTTQDITLLASPNANLWGELKGTVKDAAGNPVQGAAILVSESATGPFTAKAIPNPEGASNGAPGTPEGEDGTTTSDGTYDIVGLNASAPIYVMAAGSDFASTSAVKVTLTGGGSVTQDIVVAPRAVGNIRGTVVTPEGDFGGIGVPVTLSSSAFSLTTTTRAEPALQGTARVPADGSVTATFEFTGIAAGDYMLTLPASAVQGAAVSVPVKVTAGQNATPKLTVAYPAWSEGTADATISDALTGTALDAKWKTQDIGAPANAGSVKAANTGLTVMADGGGWDAGGDDAFYYAYQSIPAGNFVAYVTVTAAPAAGMAGLMLASSINAAPRMANFTASVRGGAGIDAEGRVADGNITFPFGETAAGTDPNNGGTQPPLPLILKLRKVGPNIAGFFSTDGGKTQRFIGNLAPQFDPAAPLLLGLATASGSDGTLDQATYQNFVFAPLQ